MRDMLEHIFWKLYSEYSVEKHIHRYTCTFMGRRRIWLNKNLYVRDFEVRWNFSGSNANEFIDFFWSNAGSDSKDFIQVQENFEYLSFFIQTLFVNVSIQVNSYI